MNFLVGQTIAVCGLPVSSAAVVVLRNRKTIYSCCGRRPSQSLDTATEPRPKEAVARHFSRSPWGEPQGSGGDELAPLTMRQRSWSTSPKVPLKKFGRDLVGFLRFR